MLPEAEIIKFEAPDGTVGRSVFVSNLDARTTSQMLRAIFLEFGAIHWLYFNESVNEETQEVSVNYALIKFYSLFAAADAVKQSGKMEICGKKIKISHPSRPNYPKRRELSVGHCVELINYYLGFDGWNSSIKETVQLKVPHHFLQQEGDGKIPEEKFVFRSEVIITLDGVDGQCVGVGFGHMNRYASKEEKEMAEAEGKVIKESGKHLSKQDVLQRAKKMAVRNAYLNAFSKIVIILLRTGKVTALILETPPDQAVDITKEDIQKAEKRQDCDTSYNPRFGELRDGGE